MQCRQPSLEGTGEVPLRRLVKEALRMRPSRIIVGEVRQAESLDLLIALNSGLPELTKERFSLDRSRGLQVFAGSESLVRELDLPSAWTLRPGSASCPRRRAGHRRLRGCGGSQH